MNKIFSLMLMLLISSGALAQKEDVKKIFEKYQDMEGVTSVNIAKPMFSLLSKLNIDDASDETVQNLKPMLSSINSLNLIVIENMGLIDSVSKSQGKLNSLMSLRDQINSTVSKLKYMELMTVNSHGKKLKFLTEESDGNFINNLLLSVTGDDTNMLMFLDGKIAMSDVNKFLASENEK